MTEADRLKGASEGLNAQAARRWERFEGGLRRRLFQGVGQTFRLGELTRQRIKMTLVFSWGYWPLLFLRPLGLGERLVLIAKFFRIDWNVVHGHLPSEVTCIAKALAERPARVGEVMIEAGCWRGGSSAKFSILCARFGYALHIFDSFEGVEVLGPADQAKEWHFGGQYASPEHVLLANLERYGRPEVCSTHKGWYSDTLATKPFPGPIRLAYIDCDLGKGTLEALKGIVPSLVPDALVFSQDFHIPPVRAVLLDPATWEVLGRRRPAIHQEGVYLARLEWRDLEMAL